ncbi:hypothetical protein H7X68_00240 [Candidatus Saccharibacteria bacterium]|nr:hypothetical protein [Candidatus Saccharibacteria bacterium]
MSELDSFESQDEGEPPSPEDRSPVYRYVEDAIDRLDGGLQYSDYVSVNNDCSVVINAYDLEIYSEIAKYEISNLSTDTNCSVLYELQRKISTGMDDVATRYGADRSLDPEYDYPVFISSARTGTVSFMFQNSNIDSVLIGRRFGSNGESLSIESRNIRTTFQQQVLLGGLAVFLTAFETKNITSREKIAVQ